MADQVSLDNLIEGLAGAVVEAQRRIESRQIENLQSFFDKHNRPRAINIRVPSLDPNAKPGQDDIYRVPLLPLVASSLLKIKEVEISFDADLLSLEDEEKEKVREAENVEDESEGTAHRGVGKKRSINVDVRGGMFRRKAGGVHVVLKVEGREPSEGMARLIDRLIQSQGVVKIPE